MPDRLNTLNIPPNTRLLSIERWPNGEEGWAIWIHTNNDELKKPHDERQGTYLWLTRDGRAYRVTINGEQEDVMPIMD